MRDLVAIFQVSASPAVIQRLFFVWMVMRKVWKMIQFSLAQGFKQFGPESYNNKTEMTFQSYTAGGTEFCKLTKNKVKKVWNNVYKFGKVWTSLNKLEYV